MPSNSVTVEITCINPPIHANAEFGLQDKDQVLHAGEAQPDGSMIFRCEIKATPTDRGMRFSGPFVHGSGTERHLYLSLRPAQGGEWIRRIKVMLLDIDEAELQRAMEVGSASLACTVDGNKPARARLLGDGWRLG